LLALDAFTVRYQSFDLLATLIAVVNEAGDVLFSNSALEDALGISRRTIVGSAFFDAFTEPSQLQSALHGASDNAFAALRYDAFLKRAGQESVPVHVIVTRTEPGEEVIVEMVPLEQQTRQDREERLAEQAQTNKELIRRATA
jgi:two-component system, NtrC family, nitrogen regulation sensor histidine kinase GlnL